MPCHYCDRPQDDPVRGASPWAVGVIAGAQVLVCPDCQGHVDAVIHLEQCPRCASTRLKRQLDTTVCRQCGWQSALEEWQA